MKKRPARWLLFLKVRSDWVWCGVLFGVSALFVLAAALAARPRGILTPRIAPIVPLDSQGDVASKFLGISFLEQSGCNGPAHTPRRRG
jgi:hypothetical protein